MDTIRLVEPNNEEMIELLRAAMAQKLKEAMLDGTVQDLTVAGSILSVFQSSDINDHVKLLLAEMFDNLSTNTAEETKIVNTIGSIIFSFNDASKEEVKEKAGRGLIVLGNMLLKL